MTSAAVSQSPKRRLWPILVVVGLLGLISTAWVTREIASVNKQHLEQEFVHVARARADEIAAAYARPLKQFFIIQRLFHAAGEVDWPLFREFVAPVVKQDGVVDYGWAPLVVASDAS